MPVRARPRPDLSFDPDARAAMEAEAGRIVAALAEAGMKPQGPGFPHVHWRRHVLPMLRRRMPREEGPTAAGMASMLAEFARGRGDPLAYVRMPLAVAVAGLPGDQGPDAARLRPDAAGDLARAAGLVADFVASAPGRVRTARSRTGR